MGVDRSRDFLRGLLVPDPRLELWDDESGEYAAGVRLSTLRSQSPVAGIPEPVKNTEMALRARGEQEEALRVRTVRAGLPVVDEAGVLWRLASDPDSRLRGRDLANVLSRWEPLQVSPVARRHPHVVTLADGTLVATWWLTGTGIQVSTRDPATGAWSVELQVKAIIGYDPHPCLMGLPSGRVHLYHWLQDGTDRQVVLHYSDDQGATWTEVGPCLTSPISATDYPNQYRLRAAYSTGQVLLVGHLLAADTATGIFQDRIGQWASSDGGHVLSLVAVQDGGAVGVGLHSGASPDVVAMPTGGFVVGRIRWDATLTRCVMASVRLGSAWEALDTVGDAGDTSAFTAGWNWGDRAGGAGADYFYLDHELALALDEDGALVAFGRVCLGANAGACPVVRSTDEGETWGLTGQTSRFSPGQSWSDVYAAQQYPTEFAACTQRGRIVLVTGWFRNGAITGYVGAAYLGGWCTHPMPSRSGVLSPTERTAWDRTGISICLPQESYWGVAGAGTEALTAGALVVTNGVGVNRYYSYVPTAAVAGGAAAEWTLQVGSGSGRMTIRLSDATPQRFEALVVVTTAYARLYDVVSGAMLGEVTPLPAARVRIRLDVAGSSVAAWITEDTTYEDRVWTGIGTGTLTAAADDPGNLIEWGCPSESVVSWWEWPITYGPFCGQHSHGMGPRNKYPQAPVPSGVWLGRGVVASATTGPTQHGDEWDITPTWEYPPEALDPRQYPSPRHPWRSRAISEMDPTTDEIRISWTMGAADQAGMSALWGAWLDGLNCAEVELHLYYGGAWHLVGATAVENVLMDRYGKSFIPDPAAAGGTTTFRRGELVQAGMEVHVGGATSWTGIIADNSPGSTRTTTGSTLRTTIRTESDVAALGAANLAVRIWPRRHLVLWLPASYSTTIRGVQLRIPVRTGAAPWTFPGPPESGYYEIGQMVCGPVWAWGWEYAHGRRINHEQGTELITAEDGSRMARELHPIRRTVELSWADPVPSYDFYSKNEPDFVTATTGGTPLAWFRATPVEVADEIRSLAGSLTPLTYLAMIPRPPVGGYAGWGCEAIYGRITEMISLDSVSGDEGVDEQFRVQAVVISEEV